MTRGQDRPTSLGSRGIGHVGLKVSDLERSRKFYREILGLTSEHKEPGIAFIHCGTDSLVLHEKMAGTSDFHFGFHVDASDQVDEWRDWLRRNDIDIIQDTVEAGRYRSIKIRDPDGHRIEIAYDRRLARHGSVVRGRTR